MAMIRPHELKARLEADPTLLVVDVRDPAAYSAGTIPGAVNVPYDDGVAAILVREVDRRRPVVLVCGWGHKSAIAGIALKREGFQNLRYLEGGLETWGLAGLPVVRGASARLAADPELHFADPERMRAAAGEF